MINIDYKTFFYLKILTLEDFKVLVKADNSQVLIVEN
jgi:hypothetical protein